MPAFLQHYSGNSQHSKTLNPFPISISFSLPRYGDTEALSGLGWISAWWEQATPFWWKDSDVFSSCEQYSPQISRRPLCGKAGGQMLASSFKPKEAKSNTSSQAQPFSIQSLGRVRAEARTSAPEFQVWQSGTTVFPHADMSYKYL